MRKPKCAVASLMQYNADFIRGELPALRLEAHQLMGAATHVTPARLHGRQPAPCHAPSTSSLVQHMSERVLCPSAWGCILGV
eukprot:1154470-Pelagomonas_calceolata.AAC.4